MMKSFFAALNPRKWFLPDTAKALSNLSRPRAAQRNQRHGLLLELLETRELPSATIFAVNTTADSGAGSLRQALLDANANPGADIIQFNIGGGGVQTIQPLSPLPAISDPVTIDGSTQPGYSGTPLIELNGMNAGTGGNAFGLYIAAGNCTVRGLAIDQFAGPGIQLTGGGGNVIAGNYIGTDANGDAGLSNGGGVNIAGSSGNTIGGAAPGDGNVISGNTGGYGIGINGIGATGNLVQGNLIGTTVNGAAALANYAGVVISSGATNNTIGGNTAAARNIVSGNNVIGIWITNAGTSNNVIEGDYVGTDVTGEAAVANSEVGILIDAGAQGNLIGTDGNGSLEQIQAERNLISGNNQPFEPGIAIRQGSNNVVAGNFIGTDATGTQSLPNSVGIELGGDNNFIGTTAAGIAEAATRNVISGNGFAGISLGSNHNVVAGNFIGTDPTGMHAIINSGYGIFMGAGQYNQIGTNGDGVNDAAEGNVIDSGLADIAVDTAAFNVIAGNLIGTDVTGTVVLAANSYGILLDHGAHDNRIGVNASDLGHSSERNVISGHNSAIDSEGGYVNMIAGNLIGSDITGLLPLGNNNGIGIDDNDDEILDNLISAANGGELGIGGSGNVVAGNLIGTDITGTASLGGGLYDGVSIGGSNNIIGGTTPGAGNIICGYARSGIGIYAAGATGNVVEGNIIGTDVTGTKALGNGPGVLIDGASGNTIGGTTAGAGNTIAYNNSDGVFLNGGSSNSILGNSIHDNGGLGISFHGGANNSQAAPVLLSAVSSISGTAISGTLAGSPGGVRIELFSNQSPDPSGFGEGQTFLGFATTDAQGNFTANLPAALQPGTFLSATATDGAGNTSEFAADIIDKAAFKPALTVTVNNVSKIYGQNNPAFSVSYSGFVNGDSPSSLGGSLIYTTTVTSASPVGAYPVTPSGLTSSNYTITFVDGTLGVTPAPLTVTANNASKTYGQNNPAFSVSYSGFVNGDSPSSLGGSLTYTTTATSASPVGAYSVTPSGLTSSNYTISFGAGTLSVTPAAVTVTINNSLMLVGNSPPPLTGSVNGTPFTRSTNYQTSLGDTITVTLSTTATAASPVGQYAITANLSGPNAGNYIIDPATSHAGTMYVVSLGADPTSTTGAQSVAFWDNKGNKAVVTAAELASLDAQNLVNQGGAAFDPNSVAQLQAWLSISPNATACYQLAVQLAVLDLNVLGGNVHNTDLVYAGNLAAYQTTYGITGLTSGGFITVQNLMSAANAVLGNVSPGAPAHDPNQAYELALAQVLSAANANSDFVSQETIWNLFSVYGSLP
jgi:hypothetical protein